MAVVSGATRVSYQLYKGRRIYKLPLPPSGRGVSGCDHYDMTTGGKDIILLVNLHGVSSSYAMQRLYWGCTN